MCMSLPFSTILIKSRKGGMEMGAIEREGYQFIPEYSVIQQRGAIHVYHEEDFIEEIPFQFEGKFPDLGLIEGLVNQYCSLHHL